MVTALSRQLQQLSQEIPGYLLTCICMAATGPPSTQTPVTEIVQKLFQQQHFGSDEQQRSVIMSTAAAFPGDPREPVGGQEQLQVTVAVHILRKQQ